MLKFVEGYGLQLVHSRREKGWHVAMFDTGDKKKLSVRQYEPEIEMAGFRRGAEVHDPNTPLTKKNYVLWDFKGLIHE